MNRLGSKIKAHERHLAALELRRGITEADIDAP